VDKALGFQKHIFPTLGDRPIAAITCDDLQAVFNKMLSEGTGIVNSYKIRNYLSGLYSHMMKFRKVVGLETNPCKGIQLPAKPTLLKPKLPPEEILDQVARILPLKSAILFDSIRTFAARPGEVTALKWRHIDFTTNSIDIVQHIRGGDIMLGTKNHVVRRVDMTPQLAQSLKAWKSISKHDGLDDWVFPARTRDGSNMPVRYNNLLRRDLKKASEKLGVPGINWKILRHSFASAAVKQGVDPITLQSIMGHKSIRTTLEYYAHVDEDVRKAWTLELSKRMYSGKRATSEARTAACKSRRGGRLAKNDVTVMTQVMSQGRAGKVEIS
jgi:integrase